MRLLRVKVAGHFVLRNSGWFTVHPGCTSIAAPSGSGKSTLLRALRAVNPPACDSDPAPFAEFPRFAESAGVRRKVLPAKKTAVIAVFVCDDPLREKLAAIDPVYWQTDRIEVGRKLDNSRWVSFVEIAASGRWSEVAQEMVLLGELAGPGRVAEELAAFLGTKASLLPTDRVKGELAEGLNGLLDRLAGIPLSKEQVHQQQKLRQIVNRAVHYQEAVRVVEESLPTFMYLDRDCLLTGIIGAGTVADRPGGGASGCRNCADLALLELLGITPLLLGRDEEERMSAPLRVDAARLDEACRHLGARLQPFSPDCTFKISPQPAAGSFEVQVSIAGIGFAPLAALPSNRRWMLSCAVCACQCCESQKRQIIFLLDEPDVGLSSQEKRTLADFVIGLCGSRQLLVTTAAAAFPEASGRQYRLVKGQSGSTVENCSEKPQISS